MENLNIWEQARIVPDTAKKEIKAGKLKGFTDINPVWRIKKLTELFGVCGIGWYPEITREWLEEREGVTCAFVDIDLYIKVDGEWSKPIPGTGGSKFVAQTRNGADVSDECFKMAYTDAISVAAKALGIGADVYFSADSASEDKTKYSGDLPDGSEKLRKREQKILSNRLIKIYGNIENGIEQLEKLTGHPKTPDCTYDEYYFAMEQLDRIEHRIETGDMNV